MSATPAALTHLTDIREFLTGGHAKFTIVSKKTGARKTFEVLRAPPRPPDTESNGFFVRLLVGPDNGSDFRYLGFLAKKAINVYFYPGKTKWAGEACDVILWLCRQLNRFADPRSGPASQAAYVFFDQAEFWHAGTCARCGRELTDPESIARGLGPVCAGR